MVKDRLYKRLQKEERKKHIHSKNHYFVQVKRVLVLVI